MASAVNPVAPAGISVGSGLEEIAERLRHVTVRIRSGANGCGSGVIWRPDGLIVTNAHVARAGEPLVQLADGRVFEGRLIAREDRRDLAALAITADGLPTPTLRDARTLRAGEVVLAVGNPLGPSAPKPGAPGTPEAAGALTAGIVQRPLGRLAWVIADLRLAPGNSGGPLADAQGLVVGINSMIVDGFGWAVPSNAVTAFLRTVSAAEVAWPA